MKMETIPLNEKQMSQNLPMYQQLSRSRRKKYIAAAIVCVVITLLIVIVVLVATSNPDDGNITPTKPPQTPMYPIVLVTWDFPNATLHGFQALKNGTALDAIENSANWCENFPEECRYSVGYGGKPNELGETTLDAMIMNPITMDVGSVGCLKNIKNAMSVARRVMEKTYHTLLVGDDATNFAIAEGFQFSNLSTDRSVQMWQNWTSQGAIREPNFWKGNHTYPNKKRNIYSNKIDENNHDTIGIVAIDSLGNVACGASTNGLAFKIPGRVGDTPIIGAGSYCEQDVGGCACTGDGDIMMRFLPSYKGVQNMKNGATPQVAAKMALSNIQKYYPLAEGGIICANKHGFGAAYIGLKNFPYTVQHTTQTTPQLIVI